MKKKIENLSTATKLLLSFACIIVFILGPSWQRLLA